MLVQCMIVFPIHWIPVHSLTAFCTSFCADNRQCWLHFINKGPVFVDNDLVVEFEGTGPNAFVQVSQFVCTLDNLGDTTPPVPIGLPNCKLSLLYSMLFFMHATKCVLYTYIPVLIIFIILMPAIYVMSALHQQECNGSRPEEIMLGIILATPGHPRIMPE